MTDEIDQQLAIDAKDLLALIGILPTDEVVETVQDYLSQAYWRGRNEKAGSSRPNPTRHISRNYEYKIIIAEDIGGFINDDQTWTVEWIWWDGAESRALLRRRKQ